MAMFIELRNDRFKADTVSDWLATIADREFVSNDGDTLVYRSGEVTITMNGYISCDAGEKPVGWDLNNSQITSIEFHIGNVRFSIDGFAMSLRETFTARELEDYRDWNIVSDYGDYVIQGTRYDDVIFGANPGETTIRGAGGDDRLYTYGQSDTVRGGSGDDRIIIANEGNAVLRGGNGADLFVMKRSDASNLILDFEAENDTIDIAYYVSQSENLKAADLDNIRFARNGEFTGEGVEISLVDNPELGTDVDKLQISIAGDILDIVSIAGGVDVRDVDIVY